MTHSASDIGGSLAVFADAISPAMDRSAALTVLISAKVLPKRADDPAITRGRSHMLAQVFASAASPEHRLLSIADSIRLGQVVKRWMPEIVEQLRPAFADELPPLQLLTDAGDRLNLARACALMAPAWLRAYLANAIAAEETGEKARAEMIAALLARSAKIEDVVQLLVSAFQSLRPDTAGPGETAAKRLARTLVALRSILLEAEVEAGNELGRALYELLALPLSVLGKPQNEKVKLDLIREALLTVHEVVRTRLSLAVDPRTYSVVSYCRRLVGTAPWPAELAAPLRRLITDVTEALVLLGRQGQRDQALLTLLDDLFGSSGQARALTREISLKHPELSEEVRDWLECGRVRSIRPATESAIEVVAGSADEGIGLALQTAKRVRAMYGSLQDPLLASLEIYEPTMVPAVKGLLGCVQVLAVQVEQVASLRALDLYGHVGEQIEPSPKFFTVLGTASGRHMSVKQPAIVRRRADGGIGEVVTKGIVE